MTRTITVQPHHPNCRYPDGPSIYAGQDPERCCYCAALMRGEAEPLDFRYGGPGCGCKPPAEDEWTRRSIPGPEWVEALTWPVDAA